MGGLLAFAVVDRDIVPRLASLKHPDPREGITAEKVLKVADLGDKPRKRVADAYAAAREFPAIFDGLACACGCLGGEAHQHRSLLVCFETRQPMGCYGCQEQSAFVARLAKDNKSLAEIRLAVDKEFD
jgi:hypothetical protein